MFTIEHDFDRTRITVIDEGDPPAPGRPAPPLREDLTIVLSADRVTLEQHDPREDRVNRITLSMAQLRDIAAALHLPEGSYRLPRKEG